MVTADDVGEEVIDSAGRVGILRAVLTDWEDPAELPYERRKRPTAFIAPEPGGVEWLVPPDTVQRV